MQREFWLDRWRNQEIGFHQPEVNPWLKSWWPRLALPQGCGVFVPLCGKSLDMGWLADQGHRVLGVELAESAVRSFYEDAQRPYRVERQRHLQLYAGDGVSIYCGDFMHLTALQVRGVAGVYDRAALIALPPKMRQHYADHLQRIVADGCRMLLLTLEYDQERVAGPPHSVPEDEVRALYGARCKVERLAAERTSALPPKFREGGVEEALEVAYLLTKRT
jgi:thiopurine S-methyltransferase